MHICGQKRREQKREFKGENKALEEAQGDGIGNSNSW